MESSLLEVDLEEDIAVCLNNNKIKILIDENENSSNY